MQNIKEKVHPGRPEGKQWLPVHGIYRVMKDRQTKTPTVVDIYFNDKLATNFSEGIIDLFKAYSWVSLQSASVCTIGAIGYHSIEKLSQMITG